MKARRVSAERTARKKRFARETNHAYPLCAAMCGAKVFPFLLQQHHVTPLSEAEHTDKRFLIYLCPNCHAFVHCWRKMKQGKLDYEQAYELGYFACEEDGNMWPQEYLARIEAIANGDISLLASVAITFNY